MCKNCKSSELGIQRQTELEAATKACQDLKVNLDPRIHGFIARHAWRNYTPQYTDAQRAALDRYNVAQQAVKTLHEDYIWGLARKSAEEARARGVKQFYITHGDKR